MRLIEHPLSVAPDPFELASRLAARPGAVMFGAPGRPLYVTSDPVERVSALDPEPALGLDPTRAALAAVPRWIGLLPYESRRDLERPAGALARDRRSAPHVCEPLWFRYGAVAEIGAARVRVLGDDEAASRELAARLERPGPGRGSVRVAFAEAPEDPKLHALRIRRALEHIARGDVYQVNLARRFRFRIAGSPFALLEELSHPEPAPFPFALHSDELDVVAASPELFLTLGSDRRLLTRPIKGTRPRTFDHRDAQLIRELDENPKECAELTMILDVERNDLGRIAETGSVRVIEPPHVETYATVHHRLSTVGAVVRHGLERRHVLEAMLPSGSVTGAPKIRAMELCAGLEDDRRGLYTGAFGAIFHDGGTMLAMAIRTLTIVGGEGHYFSGGGIVADSDPELEVEETLWKARRILELAGSRAGNWEKASDAAR